MKRCVWVLWLAAACGDDGGGGATTITPAGTSTDASTGASTSSTTDATQASESSTGVGSESSTGGSGSSESSGSGSSTGTIAGDPAYPPVEGGACPGDAAPTQLPGGSICAPFCRGDGAKCPAAATGDAAATCTPFERDGGSGDPCETHATCPRGEACGLEDTCVAVAFWACQLVCDGGQTCPDDMTCTTIGACGYP